MNSPRNRGPRIDAKIAIFALGAIGIFVSFFLARVETLSHSQWMPLVALIACYSVLSAIVFRALGQTTPRDGVGSEARSDHPEKGYVEDRFIALDEANEFFASSLNAADMFRLVASRVREILPFSASSLVVRNSETNEWNLIQAEAGELGGIETEAHASQLCDKALAEKRICIDRKLGANSANFKSGLAIPLFHADSVFGVYQIFFDGPIATDDEAIKLYEAIGEHVTPLFRRSMAFEQSVSNALTDGVTGLPNERAFFMVLENQLAESTRSAEERPLTILSIDIRDFAAVNSMLGHAVGDRLLEFAGSKIRTSLRKMDFLARTVNDEFSVILPTAGEAIGKEIIERIKTGIAESDFAISDEEHIEVVLNIGWATCWKDGETVSQLVRAAQQRKRQAKSEGSADVIWFPKEYVN